MGAFKLVFLVSISAAVLVSAIEAFQSYRNNIPNGRKVYDPCPPHDLVYGVGHMNPYGSGPNNHFGVRFADNGHQWTPTLCREDSDLDGKSNGEELGDPNCEWVKGSTPKRTTNITSPGISNNCYEQ